MRTNITYIALTALVLAGCVRESFSTDTPLEGIIINLELEEPQTKATRDGDASLNENVVSSTIDLFFYNESTLEITREVLGALRTGTLVQIQTNPNDIEDIFGTRGAGAHCGIFVVANFGGTYNGTPGSRTLTEIQSSLLPAPNWESFPQGTPAGGFVAQTSFVMTGQKQITLGNAQGSTPVSETVSLARIAAKVTFDVTVAGTVAGEESTWTPDLSNMSVYMVYAMRKATLGAEPVDMPVNANVTYTVNNASETVVFSQYRDKVLYDTGTTIQRQRGNTTVNAPVYSTTYEGASRPFYAYPCAWETGSAMEPYMKLIIPWTYGNTTRKYYYKIPFHGNELERNHWYHISIDVQILGTEQADPPEVTVNYAIAPWSGTMDTATAEEITSVTSVPAEVIMTRYLSVPTTEYILYNEDQLVIPIQSSHDVEVVGFNVDESKAYKPAHVEDDDNYIGSSVRIYNPYLETLNLSAVNAVRPNYQNDPPTPVVSASGWTITTGDRLSIRINHSLNRDMSSADFDVAPYTLRFRIRHESDPDNYFTDVIIEQRPSIIIEPQHNSDYGDILTPTYDWRGNLTSAWGAGHTTEDGYVFINGTRTKEDQKAGRSNTNFNMYVVETSVLPTTGALSNYVLGDPRQTTSVSVTSGYSANSFATGVDIAGGANRRMANYYPAAEDDDHKYFVAPSFRVASSFGTSSAMSRDDAVYRCAVYQEDGYPAGRWRLPTEAEVYYMITLSQKGKIPTLFSPDEQVNNGGYWNANGAIFPLNGGSIETRTITEANNIHSGTHWARCVYDEWFWDDTTHEKAADKTVWTWGDEALNTVSKL